MKRKLVALKILFAVMTVSLSYGMTYEQMMYGGGSGNGNSGGDQGGGNQGGDQGGNQGGNQGGDQGNGNQGSDQGGGNPGDGDQGDGDQGNDKNQQRQESNQQVYDAVQTGNDLSNIPTDALKQAYSDLPAGSENDSTRNSIMEEINKRDKTGSDEGNGSGGSGSGEDSGADSGLSEEAKKEIAEAEQAAKAAEDAAAEAVKDYTEAKDRTQKAAKKQAKAEKNLDKREQKLKKQEEKSNVTQQSLRDLEKAMDDVEKAKKELAESTEELNKAKEEEKKSQERLVEAADDMKDAYNHLSDVYREYNYAGDPVRIDTGEFVAKYEDFRAKDYISRFKIERQHISQDFDSSFGPYWTCPLDARLVYGEPESVPSDYLENLADMITCSDKIAEIYRNYNEKYTKFPHDHFIYNQKAAEYNSILLQDLYESEYLRKYYADQIKERNKYATYGKYSDFSNYHRISDIIFFTDSDGSEYIFGKDGNTWKTYGTFQKKKLSLVSYGSEGIRIKYSDGYIKDFDSYGILLREEDRNGNLIVYENEKGKITKIELPSMEKLTVTRNSDGHITKISGPISGTASYEYSGNKLTGVTDNSGIKVTYSYDSEGNITSIGKADGTKVSIKYEKDSYTGRSVCKSVTNENNQNESFAYNYQNGKVSHKNTSGNTESYELSADGFITKYTDENGNVVQITPSANGLIQTITRNGNRIDYTYDENFNPVKAVFSRGGSEEMKYNSFGQLKSLKDRDGFIQSYTYDDKGNITGVYYCGTLITSATYNSKGLVKSVTENGITYNYEYNNQGYMTNRSYTDSYGRKCKEIWEYDKHNRVIYHQAESGEITSIKYDSEEPNSAQIIRRGNSLETTKVFDARNRLSKIEQKDLLTGRTISQTFVYDGSGNVVQVNLDGKLYAKYSYNARSNVTEYTVYVDGHQIKTSFTYNSLGYFTGETVTVDNQAPVTKYTCSYSQKGNQKVVSVNCGGQIVKSYYYNDEQRLVKIVNQDGYTKNIAYSTAGRISSIKDSNGNTYSYKYNTDGTKQITAKDVNGYSSIYKYNSANQLVSVKDVYNQLEKYTYDSNGKLIKKSCPVGETEFYYDSKGRCISKKVKTKAGKVEYTEETEFNDEKRIITKYKGNQFYVRQTYDAWNYVIREETGKEIYEYEYDNFGNCIREKDSSGNSIEYKYSPANKLIEKKNLDDVITRYERLSSGKLSGIFVDGVQTFAATYDGEGRATQVTNNLGNKLSYTYDSQTGIISSVSRYDTGKAGYTWNVDSKVITVVDANKNKVVYEVGKNGRIEKEIDQMGEVTIYSYDEKGRLIQKKYPTEFVETYAYDDVANTVTVSSSFSEKRVFYKNSIGKITKVENKDSVLTFDYDTAGRLVKSNDSFTNIPIEYFYDSNGNCIQKKSAYFDYHYEYDKKGNVTKASDRISGIWIEFERDVRGRVTKEKYSNGVEKTTEYNSLGEKTCVKIKNRFGAIVSSQNLTYDENNKLSLLLNEKGEAWKYDYDSDGRLIKVTSPYTEDQRLYALEEAKDCGFGIKNEKPDGIQLKLENGKVQYSWWEEYTYTDTGAVKTTKNPFGTINYEYDEKNRIIAKRAANTSSGGMKIVWNEHNQLKTITTPEKKIILSYKLLDPMYYMNIEMKEDSSDITYTYTYDGLGRCIQKYNKEFKVDYVYDGLTDNVIISTPAYHGKKLIQDLPSSLEREYNYRWLDDDQKYELMEEIKGIKEQLKTSAIDKVPEFSLNDYRPYTQMVVDGKSAVEIRIDGKYDKKREIQYIISDYRGHKTGVLNENGDFTITNNYDAWGVNLKSPVTVEQKGSRYYVPSLKTFTTQDFARDGGNWYSYCPCDPVNYEDNGGTIKRRKSNTPADDAAYEAAVSEFLKYDKDEAMETGESQGIPNEYDCQDVSSFIDDKAREEAGIEDTNSKKQKEFDDKQKEVDKKREENSDYDPPPEDDPRNVSRAKDYWDEGWEESYRKVGEDYDDISGDDIGPGTTIVFRTEDGSKTSHDHVITIIAVDYDENGNIVGVAFIEGHVNDLTNVEYAFFTGKKSWGGKDGVWNLGDWLGELVGFFEAERNDTVQKCEK